MGDLDKSLFELSRAISKSSLQPFYKRDLPCSSREVKQKFWKNDVFFWGGGKGPSDFKIIGDDTEIVVNGQTFFDRENMRRLVVFPEK